MTEFLRCLDWGRNLPGQPWLKRSGVASFFCENSPAKWISYVSPSSSTGTLKFGTLLMLSWYLCLRHWSASVQGACA